MIEPVQPSHREKFTGDKKEVEVYISPDKGVFLKIDHQTFELKSNRLKGEKYEHHSPEDLQAHSLCVAINRLMERCAKEVFDNRPLTERLKTKEADK